MKYDSKRRSCLFNGPQWSWHASKEFIEYPYISNKVEVDHPRKGVYSVFVAVPSEIYLVMLQKNINQIYGFRLKDKLFIAETDQGDLNLWVYDKWPNWTYKN